MVDQYRSQSSPAAISPTWRAFPDNHIKDMVAIDFFKRRSGISVVPLRPFCSQPDGRESVTDGEGERTLGPPKRALELELRRQVVALLDDFVSLEHRPRRDFADVPLGHFVEL